MEGLQVELKNFVMNMLLIPKKICSLALYYIFISLSLKSDFQVYLSIDIIKSTQ
jgi:hypothetical protein